MRRTRTDIRTTVRFQAVRESNPNHVARKRMFAPATASAQNTLEIRRLWLTEWELNGRRECLAASDLGYRGACGWLGAKLGLAQGSRCGAICGVISGDYLLVGSIRLAVPSGNGDSQPL